MTNDIYITALANPAHVYHDQARRLAAEVMHPDHATLADGVLRWTSNGRVPPEDVVALAASLGLAIDEAKCDAARRADLRAFLKGYNPVVTDEDRFEMRAAFGAGSTVVNVITGTKIKL